MAGANREHHVTQDPEWRRLCAAPMRGAMRGAMRIAIISGEYPPLEGGVGDFTQTLGLELLRQGHELHILTGKQGAATVSEEEGLTIHRCIKHWGFSAYAQIARWIANVQPDVINIQYQPAIYEMKGAIHLLPRWQQRRFTQPLITTFHDLRVPYLFPKAGRLREWAVLQLAKHSQGVILTNDEDYATITQKLHAAQPGPRYQVIPIGSNIAPAPPAGYERTAWRSGQQFAPQDFLIGFFGFLNRSKGVETLLDALAQLRQEGVPAHLLLIGGQTGSSDPTNRAYADEITARIAAARLERYVHRTGFATPAEVSAALLACDACALPYRDGVSLRRGTLHAALAHGQAIITTAPQTPSKHFRDGENMLLVSPDNPAELAEALRELWRAPELRAELGQQAKRLAAEFGWNRIAAHTVGFFRQLCRDVDGV
ncbi:MAG: glycosyltransferase family 4 protein [Anaerolineae bacterium]|nr:glycosyltransferase family 4 protein [Anaerolineae bacterium]